MPSIVSMAISCRVFFSFMRMAEVWIEEWLHHTDGVWNCGGGPGISLFFIFVFVFVFAEGCMVNPFG
jgi:hypothetical protein